MQIFDIKFNFKDHTYTARVTNTHNIYRVSVNDGSADLFGELLLIEANGDFAWQDMGADHYQYSLSVAKALKEYLGFAE